MKPARKFSEAYRHTHVYAVRRLAKALRAFWLEIVKTVRRSPTIAALLDLLNSRVVVKRSEFPCKCYLCGLQIESVDDRIEWHGLGNCVEICDACLGTALDETQPDPEAAGLSCPACDGRGWFPMMPLENGARAVTVVPLRFPDRPIIPTKDARFDG